MANRAGLGFAIASHLQEEARRARARGTPEGANDADSLEGVKNAKCMIGG